MGDITTHSTSSPSITPPLIRTMETTTHGGRGGDVVSQVDPTLPAGSADYASTNNTATEVGTHGHHAGSGEATGRTDHLEKRHLGDQGHDSHGQGHRSTRQGHRYCHVRQGGQGDGDSEDEGWQRGCFWTSPRSHRPHLSKLHRLSICGYS